MYSYLNYQHEGPTLPLTTPTTFFRNITAKRALSLLLHYTALLKNRLGGLERVRGGEKVIIRARERKEEKSICSSRLSRSCFTLSQAQL